MGAGAALAWLPRATLLQPPEEGEVGFPPESSQEKGRQEDRQKQVLNMRVPATCERM